MDPVLEVALDTLDKKKQALVFVNTKRSAEKVAEDISKKLELDKEGVRLGDKVRKVLSRPTVQCERLSKCVRKAVAFHHAGLHSEQKSLVEDAFREGRIRIICCTPTLAAGLDLPAFRAIIRDVRRFTGRGMSEIPVLEYLQMAGRAGRPKFDEWGEAVVIASSEAEKDAVVERYLNGQPESIFSKLAVEPVLRSSVLSLISTRLVRSAEEMYEFFSQTLWAHQFKDLEVLNDRLDRTVSQLEEWGFLDGFRATKVGKRVAELYIDPYSAFKIITGLKRAHETTAFSWAHLVCCCLELRPLLRVRTREYDDLQEMVAKWAPYFLEHEPSMFEPEYEDWLCAVKTAWMFDEWMDEKDEQWLLEHFDVRPGELHGKLDTADWLLYAAIELAKVVGLPEKVKLVAAARKRLQYGVREELLPVLRVKYVGRVRARKLFSAGIRSPVDVRDASFEKLSALLGAGVAAQVLKGLK